VLLCCLTSGGLGGKFTGILDDFYQSLFRQIWGFQMELVPVAGIVDNDESSRLTGWVISGTGAAKLLELARSTQLMIDKEEFVVAVMRPLQLADGENPAAVLSREAASRSDWINALLAGNAAPEADPYRIGEIMRLFEYKGITLDFRSGLVCRQRPRGRLLRRLLLEGLPPPPKLREEA